EEWIDPDSPVPKLTMATKKSKPSAPKADLRPLVTKPASSQQPKPKPAPAKSQEKKRKLVTKMSDKPSPAKRSKPGLVPKRRKPTSYLRTVDEAMEESLKSVHYAPRGPLPPVVIREPNSGKFQPLPKVHGKGKGKVSDEHVARDLLTLQTPKKKSHDDQFIFQRHTSTPTESSGNDESSSLFAELGGPLPPVVIREPNSGKFQPLPKVQGKGKGKVSNEHVARDLLTLQTPKKKSHADQFIFQRHTSTPTESSGNDESSSLYAELGLLDT
nr:hypothetical protein [Tanacetum cinerariifolium]